MFCRYCGKELPDAAKFCRFCGKEIKAAPKAKEAALAQQPVKINSPTVAMSSSDNGELGDTLNSKPKNLSSQLLFGRGIGNLIQIICWVLLVVSFFLPIIDASESNYGGGLKYSEFNMLVSFITDNGWYDYSGYIAPYVVLLIVLFVVFFLMLFSIGMLVFKNKKTIRSNIAIIGWSCVDLVYQFLIIWFVSWTNDRFNAQWATETDYSPFQVGVAVSVSLFAASVIIVFAACAIMQLKEAQAGKIEDSEGALHNP